MADGAWSLAEAKAKFSELVEKARSEGPQHVTRNGKEAVVIVSAEDWAARDEPSESLYDFLARSPLRGTDIEIERIRGRPRDLDF
ncbi:MAG TPA: type II toxin-antitoxin system Phd/YefM family antitoxin [Caulobacteraceae bacterium]|nr:type II toxin-antitoxin system Phd/YefM family antitoxin [Caulobacteraceae bacterium]